jgi:ATP-dependent helicase/nuclease subunit A
MERMPVSTGDTKTNLTPEQEASIGYRGGALLVSAAAGSGKTKVLVERLLSFVDEGANIDEFLVITYTRAAAFELRERIYEQLLKKLNQSPGNLRLRRQILLCKGASIDTIHTFCSEILRENAHHVKLPPDFRVADESESTMIMNEAADKVLGVIYENLEDYPGFTALIDTVADRRDDRFLVETLFTLYRKLQSSANPGDWIKKQIEKQKNIFNINDISQTDFGTYMLGKLKSKIEYCQIELRNLKAVMQQHPEFEIKYADSINSVIEQIYPLLSSIDLGWDAAREHSQIDYPRPKPIKGYEKLKETRTRSIKELKNSIHELESSSEEHIKDARDISPAITALLRLVTDFGNAYTEEKRKRGIVDFSDLEHLTLFLLIDMETGTKTDLAGNISSRYREIMIDEYQDVNAVQEYIFTAISKNSDNIFMVGDVKQSIYRFRLADPTIFLSKYNKFAELEANALSDASVTGKKIHLSRNFRSHEGILNVVNHIFHNIMSKEFGELEYTDKEWLVSGRTSEEGKQGIKGKQGTKYREDEILLPETDGTQEKDTAVEIDILDMSTLEADDDESPTAIRAEAEFVARKIEKLIIEGCKVPETNGGERNIRYSDIVILLRSMKGRAWQFASALSENNIPIEFPGGEGYFETAEVTAALSLLAVIDNPIQDIPIASVMSGPLYGFTPDELAELKVIIRSKNYYDTIKESVEHDNLSSETRLKCKKMLQDIEELRLISTDMPSDRFIWHMYNRTGLLDLVTRMRGGTKRKDNLILLAESARKFEKNGYKGVFGFLRFIRNMQERGIELIDVPASNGSTSENYDAVKIMSIHKSKGLEFPVVFLANTAKLNNFQDIRKNVVFHTDLGIGSMLIDRQRRIRFTTLARKAIQTKLNDEMLSEELRVLYVAMTRAREKLFITAAMKNTEKTLEKLSAIPEGIVAPQAVLSLRSMIEWILVGVRGCEDKDVKINYIDADVLEEKPASDSENDLYAASLAGSKITYESNLDILSAFEAGAESDLLLYPYEAAVDLPSKLTVTGLKKLLDPEAELAPWLQDLPEPDVKKESTLYPIPSFISGLTEMTAADRGTLLHRVMQYIDYKKCSREHKDTGVAKELQRLNSEGLLTEAQVAEIDTSKLNTFFLSALGGRMISAEKLSKEFKYSVLRPCGAYFPNGGEDKILLQGIIDCYFEEDGEIVVVDFKTDKVTEKTVSNIAQHYTQQLNEYADALFHITGKRVKEKIIYFFSIDRAYSLE